MSQHYEEHAKQVATAFFELLEDSVKSGISEAHRDQLAMLIEASISTAVFEQLEKAAGQVAQLSSQLRQHAERYDKATA